MIVRPVLVTGGSGQLGTELTRARWPVGYAPVTIDRASLDLSDAGAIATCVADGHAGQPFAAVINAAAYTGVDAAERDQVTAWRINALAPAALGQACAEAAIPIVQVSTDYVFSGDHDGAWRPDDRPAPLGVYGASKFGGELAVAASGAHHAIVRTAWLVSAHGHNFVKTMLRLATDRDRLRIVEDQWGSPTAAADLAQALTTIVFSMAENAAAPRGIFHFSNTGTTNWADFAREIFRQSATRAGPHAEVDGIASRDYPTLAQRPSNSLLDTGAIGAVYGITPRPWQAALDDILDELIGARA